MVMRTAAVVAAVVALAACGGGGETRLSHDAYVAKADAICRDIGAKQKRLAVPTSTGQIPTYVKRALPIFDDALARIHALRPPSELDARVQAWLDGIAESRQVVSDIGKAAERNDAAKVQSLGNKAVTLGEQGRSRAGAIGLTDCAKA